MIGTIRKVVEEKGFGFIEAEDGNDYFFHRSTLRDLSFSQSIVGIKVEFVNTMGQKGLRAEEVFRA